MINKVIFSSEIDILNEFLKVINKTKKNIFIAIFIFDYRPIIDSILNIALKNVNVKIVADKRSYNSLSPLRFTENIHIKFCDLDNNIMHQKFLIVDDEIVLNGSYNFQEKASKGNLENFVISSDPYLINRFKLEFDKMYLNCYYEKKQQLPNKFVFLLKNRRKLILIIFIHWAIIMLLVWINYA